MYRVQLYRFELQDEEKDGGNLEIDTEVESVYQVIINNNFLKEIKYHNFIDIEILNKSKVVCSRCKKYGLLDLFIFCLSKLGRYALFTK